jgi:hypothetical protein
MRAVSPSVACGSAQALGVVLDPKQHEVRVRLAPERIRHQLEQVAHRPPSLRRRRARIGMGQAQAAAPAPALDG